MKPKKAKPVYDLGPIGVRHESNMNEKRKNADPETKPFVRPGRSMNDLGQYDTGKIPKMNKNWKSRVKKAKQWMHHIFGTEEKKIMDKFIHMYKTYDAGDSNTMCGKESIKGTVFRVEYITCPECRAIAKKMGITSPRR